MFGEVCCYVSLAAAAALLFLSAGAAAVVWAGVLPPVLLRLSDRLTGVCRPGGRGPGCNASGGRGPGCSVSGGCGPGGGVSGVSRSGSGGRPVWPLLIPALFLAGMLRMADAAEWSGLAARTMETEDQVQVRAVMQVDEIRRTDSSLQFYTRTILEIREQDSKASIPGNKTEQIEGADNANGINRPEDSAQLYGAVVTLKGDEEATENIKIGDVITGEGTFTLFDAATNFGQFDLRKYYKAQGLEGRIKLNSWQWDSGSRFRLSDAGANLVYRGKQFLLGRLYRAMGAEIGANTGEKEGEGAREKLGEGTEEGEGERAGGGAGEKTEAHPGKDVGKSVGGNAGADAERDAGLLGAILTGEKSGISDEDQKLFQESGISHMYAVSGLHASFFGWGLYGILKKLGASRKVCSAGAGIGLWMLVIAAGGSVSVKRAFCMFLLSLLAGLAGRTYDLLISLSAACMLILWERPLMLFQSGFQLSFCAVLGIVAAAGVMKRNSCKEEADSGDDERDFDKREKDKEKSKWKKRKEQFKKGLTASLWIQLALLPSTLWNFFQYPCYGILLNLVVIPMLSVVLALGFFAMALSCVWVSGAGYCLIPVRGIFWFWRFLCRTACGLPGALWLTGRPKASVLVIFCIVLFCFWVCSFRKKWGSRSWYPGCLALLLLVSLSFLTRRPDAGLQVTFLDVGQGDGIYMREESGYTMMIDGGSSDSRKVGENRILPMIKASGSGQVDDWFLSHPDQDHLSGLKEILSVGLPIERLWIPEVFREEEVVLELLELAEENGTEVRFTRPGVLVSDGGEEADSFSDNRGGGDNRSLDGYGSTAGFSLTCLYPEPDEPVSSSNDGSMVLLARYEGVNILFTGDLEASGEARLLARSGQSVQLSCDILKVGHHGSKGSTSQTFLTELNPFFAVISCGRGNSYGHPHPELLSRLEKQGCQVVSTMEAGAVTLRIRRGRIYLYSREQRAK